MRKIMLVVGLMLIAIFNIPTNTFAAEADEEIGLALRPAIMELAAEPGETISSTIFIQNISPSPVGVEVSAQSLIPNDPTIDQQKRKNTDASTWLINKGRKFLLDAGEQRPIDIQFLVPQNASPGGHYAMVTFTTSSVQQQLIKGSIVTPSLTSLALINVAGDILEEASVERLDFPFLVFGRDQTLSFNIANTGNTHILPTTTVKLYDRNDRLVDSISVPPQLILPNTTKKYDVKWSTNGKVGIHRVQVDVSYGSPRQFATLNTGTIVLLPSLSASLFGLLSIIGLGLVVFMILKKPVRRLYWNFKGIGGGYKFRQKNRSKAVNRPEDMARLSMSSAKLDDLLISNSTRHPSRRPSASLHTAAKGKKKKTIIR